MTTDSLLGKQLDEYRLEVLLGQGGMARVYRGLDVRLNRYVAVKVIDAPFRADPDYVVRFEREAQAIAQLDHPHIVRLYRYGEAEGLLYIAMQYIRGASLSYVLDSYRADKEFIAPNDAQRIMREVCLALDYAHSHGVIHRDIKPANIILDQQGRAYLTDFGLALLTEVGTRGEILGSPHYIAPEQAISSAAAVPQSDLYSVGVILYEMFTGKLPFDAEEPLEIARLHMTEPPRPPQDLRPELSRGAEAVLLRALAKEPDERYPTGAALADALDEALRAAPVPLPSPPTLARPSIPERVKAERARRPLPPLPAAVEASVPRQAGPDIAPARMAGTASAPARRPSTFTILERIGGLADLPKAWRRRYRIFIGIIVLAGLCYCAGFAALALAPSGRITLDMATATRWSPAINPSVTLPPAVAAVTPSPSPSPTSSPTPTPTSSPTLTMTPSPTDTTTPSPTHTLTPTDTSTPTSVPTATAVPGTYALLIARRGDDSLFVINESTLAFPLAPLRLANDRAAINGSDWGVDMLEPGACVTAWKDSGNPQPPRGINCREVGSLTRDGPNRFWKDDFNVY
ncbi:MAG TPA: protein kinase, partial [Anaerolineae bacterium]|nr:protein kinase [Anaerolineae bacterium]